jgi:GNAT superfamily N-acetyltransferase
MSFSLLTDDAAITWDGGDVTGIPRTAVTDADLALEAEPVAASTPTGPWFERGTPEHAFLVLRAVWPTAEVEGQPPAFEATGGEALMEATFETRLHPRDRRGRFIEHLRSMLPNSLERMANYDVQRTADGRYLVRHDLDPLGVTEHDTPEEVVDHVERVAADAERAHHLTAETLPDVYDGFEHNGMRAEVSQRWGGGCSGMILVGDDDVEPVRQVGSFAREIDMARDGVHVYHDTLSIKPEYQGKGFGTAFFEHSVEQYKARGVKSLRVTAASTVGGYQWAMRGFDFWADRYKVLGAQVWMGVQPQREGIADDDRFARAYAVYEIKQGMEKRAFPENKVLGDVPDEHFAEFESKFPTHEKLVAYVKGDDSALDGTFTSPQEIALFGRNVHRWTEEAERSYRGREMWLGKRALLGAGWRGEMRFG